MMSQMDHVQISEKESQIIAENHLGSPLRVYQLKRFYIFLCSMEVILFQIIFLALVILLSVYIYSSVQRDQFFFVNCIFAILLMYLSLRLSVFNILNSKERIVLCENGLFKTSNVTLFSRIEVAYWQDIMHVTRDISSYNIAYRGKQRAFTFHIGYQSYKELVNLIKEKSNENIH